MIKGMGKIMLLVVFVVMWISADRAVAGEIKNDEKCLGIAAEEMDNGQLVRLFTCDPSTNQEWVCRGNEIQSSKGQCLGVARDGKHNIVTTCTEKPRQYWKFPLGKQGGVIQAKGQNKCLEAEGDDVILKDCTIGVIISSEKLQHEAEKLKKKMPPENIDDLEHVVEDLQRLTNQKIRTQDELLGKAKTQINNEDLFNKYGKLISNSIESVLFPISAQRWFVN